MANQEHLALISQGRNVWDTWRVHHPDIQADLSEADLSGANLFKFILRGANLFKVDLSGADLSGADLDNINLTGANLSGANLFQVDLSGADLRGADLSEADLSAAYVDSANLSEANLSGANLSRATLSGANLTLTNLSGANLTEANLSGANLFQADLSEANLSGANLTLTNLSRANLSRADLSWTILVCTLLTNATLKGCNIYGISAWDVELDGAKQLNLTITSEDQPTITVDNLEVAQFIYLLLNNPKIRDVIDTVAQKAVLILGRFTPTRKPILEAIRTALRSKGYVPILFDFEKPSSKDLTETVSTLAHLSRFIIADLTDPSSIPHELGTIIPNHVVPIVPLFHPTDSTRHEYAMFQDLRKRHRDWVLPIHHYTTLEDLLTTLQSQIIEPAEKRAQELIIFKNTKETEFL